MKHWQQLQQRLEHAGRRTRCRRTPRGCQLPAAAASHLLSEKKVELRADSVNPVHPFVKRLASEAVETSQIHITRIITTAGRQGRAGQGGADQTSGRRQGRPGGVGHSLQACDAKMRRHHPLLQLQRRQQAAGGGGTYV